MASASMTAKNRIISSPVMGHTHFLYQCKIRRMKWMLSLVATAVGIAVMSTMGHGQPRPCRIVEATIAEMQSAMAEKRLTSRELVSQSLVRIGLYENRLPAPPAAGTRGRRE